MKDARFLLLSLILCAFCLSPFACAYTVTLEPDESPLFFKDGETLILTCTVHTDEDVDMVWLKYQSPIEGPDVNFKTWRDEDESGTTKHLRMTIPLAGPEDVATYTCRIDDDPETDMDIMTVIPVGGPGYEVSVEPYGHPLWFMEGKPLTMTCTVDTEEEVNMEWQKDWQPVNASVYELEKWITDDDTGMKTHLKLTKHVAGHEDEATFVCRIEDGTEKEVQTQLFSVFTRNANVTEGYDTTMKCNPFVTIESMNITWLKDDIPLDEVPELKGRIALGHANETVSIQSPKLSDSGVYACRLEIFQGDRKPQTFTEHVLLQGKPFIDKTDKLELLQNVTNTTIVLKCPAKGYPHPQVFWFRGDDVIEANENIRMVSLNGVESGQLEVTDPTEADFGEYICTAENSMGKDEHTYNAQISGFSNMASRLGPDMGVVSKVFLSFVSFLAIMFRLKT